MGRNHRVATVWIVVVVASRASIFIVDPASWAVEVTSSVGISHTMSVAVIPSVIVITVTNWAIISSIRIIIYNYVVVIGAHIVNVPRSINIEPVIHVDVSCVVGKMTVVIVEDMQTSYTR